MVVTVVDFLGFVVIVVAAVAWCDLVIVVVEVVFFIFFFSLLLFSEVLPKAAVGSLEGPGGWPQPISGKGKFLQWLPQYMTLAWPPSAPLYPSS